MAQVKKITASKIYSPVGKFAKWAEKGRSTGSSLKTVQSIQQKSLWRKEKIISRKDMFSAGSEREKLWMMRFSESVFVSL